MGDDLICQDLHPDPQIPDVEVDPAPTLIEQRLWDFRKVSGGMFSFANTETDLKTGKVLEMTTVRSTLNGSRSREAIVARAQGGE
jgi:hypothetical protein